MKSRRSLLFENVTHGFFVRFSMQMLSLNARALLLALGGFIGDFGSAGFQLWALVFAFAFSY